MTERWIAIPDWPGYEVSDFGRVRSWKWPNKRRQWIADTEREPRILRSEVRNGYAAVLLSDGHRRQKFSVHRLVLTAWIRPARNGEHAAHGNGDPRDNRLSNLRWTTPRDNNADKRKHGTLNRGSSVGNAKLTESQVTEIRHALREGAKVRFLANSYGVHRNTISNIKAGLTYQEARQ